MHAIPETEPRPPNLGLNRMQQQSSASGSQIRPGTSLFYEPSAGKDTPLVHTQPMGRAPINNLEQALAEATRYGR